MLQSIRDRMTGIVAFFIMGALAMTFARWGVEQYFVGPGTGVAATVGDTEISMPEFRESFGRYRQQVQSQQGEAFDFSGFDTPIRRRQHLDAIIDERILQNTAAEHGFIVPDQLLAQQIMTNPAFLVDGEFNRDVYQSRLRGVGMTPQGYEASLKRELSASQIPGALQASALATEYELSQFISLAEQKRSFDALLVPVDVDSEEISITDDEVRAYYEENPSEFQADEKVVVEYIELRGEDFASEVEVSDEAIERYYQAHESEFIEPEQRRARHILIEVAADADEATRQGAKAQAESLQAQLQEGADFAELAKEFSDDTVSAEEGGDLGLIEPGVMVPAFEDAVYRLAENEVSDPVETRFGWHLIEVTEVIPAEGMSLEQAREQLVERVRSEQTEEIYLEQAERLVDEALRDTTSLQPAAAEIEAEVQTSEPFTRAGGSTGIAQYPAVVSAAFSELLLEAGANSEAIEVDDNHLFVIRVKERIPAQPESFESVAAGIRSTLRQRRATEMATERAQALLDRIQSGTTTMQELAEVEGDLQFVNFDQVSRNAPENNPVLVAAAFSLNAPEEGEVERVVRPVGNQVAVIELSDVTSGSLENQPEPMQAQYQRFLAFRQSAEEISAMRDQLRANADVEINEEQLEGR